METSYRLQDLKTRPAASAVQNACKLCSPLGAALVFKGIEGAVPLLHGSQGCSTYIRRYLISHFKEPIDIACSNFGEQTAIFGGAVNIKLALDNIIVQYAPRLIGVATTCLAETIGDDVPMFIREYRNAKADADLPPMIHVSTPSYQGTHMQGFHRAVKAVVAGLAGTPEPEDKAPEDKANDQSKDRPKHRPKHRKDEKTSTINLFPGMVSPADLRHLKQIVADFGLRAMVLPDYTRTLDGGLWAEYQRLPSGGTSVGAIGAAHRAPASIELGRVLAGMSDTAATYLGTRFGVPAHRLGFPMGVRQTDRFMETLALISGKPVPEVYRDARGRLLDAMVDGHKYVNGLRAVVYGEADLVAGLVDFLCEIGIVPVICATGDGSGRLETVIREGLDKKLQDRIEIIEGVDFVDIEARAREVQPDLLIGNSKGYSLARKLGIPLVRVGFPIHDRVGGNRILHLCYDGALALFDRLTDTVIERRQAGSDVGYTYM